MAQIFWRTSYTSPGRKGLWLNFSQRNLVFVTSFNFIINKHWVKKIGIRKSEFLAKTQFKSEKNSIVLYLYCLWRKMFKRKFDSKAEIITRKTQNILEALVKMLELWILRSLQNDWFPLFLNLKINLIFGFYPE